MPVKIDFQNLSKKDKLRGLKIPNKITPNLAYLCGIFAGDGSINFREKKKEYSIKCVGNPKDEKPLYRKIIGQFFEEVFGFCPTMKYCDAGTTFGFVIYSKTLVKYLTGYIGLPLGSKYDSLKIPFIFLNNDDLLISFIRGVFDTDGSISFKKRYRKNPYYPVISFSSKSHKFTKEVATALKKYGFKAAELYNYKLNDTRVKDGFTIINRIDLNGKDNLRLWIQKIGFLSPKHKNKIEKYWKDR